MTQNTFPDGPPVPLLVDGVMEASALQQLFTDLAAFAKLLGVREKNGQVAYANPTELPLEAALDRLLSGITQASQVRYLFDGHEWTDTIFAIQGGFRVVRCQHKHLK